MQPCGRLPGGPNRGSSGISGPRAPRVPTPGLPERVVLGGENRSAAPRWVRGGAAPELCGHGRVRPPPGFRRAWTAECAGRQARSELGAHAPASQPRASRLLGAQGATREFPSEGRRRAPGPASPPPAAPRLGLTKSPPVGAPVARASAGATYPGQSLLLVQRALGLQR